MSFEMLRGEPRSFFCPNTLWYEMKKVTKDCIPISRYMRMAIIEKMKRECPEKSDYFESLAK